MKANMGTADKLLRLLAAIVLALLFFAKQLTGTAGIIALVIAGVFLLTSLISFCPLYKIFGISTCKKQHA